MANPRNTTDFEGIRNPADDVTYVIDDDTITYDEDEEGGSAQVGLAVTLSDDREVALTADGDEVKGKLIHVERDGKCTVQEAGHMSLPGGDSATLTNGVKIVGALRTGALKGGIRAAASGTAAELLKGRGEIIDNSDATAVRVRL